MKKLDYLERVENEVELESLIRELSNETGYPTEYICWVLFYLK